MKNGENFNMLYELADKLGGAGEFSYFLKLIYVVLTHKIPQKYNIIIQTHKQKLAHPVQQ